jgi:hypothetical protein
MRRVVAVVAVALVMAGASGAGAGVIPVPEPTTPPSTARPQLTPVVVSPLSATPPAPVVGTDGLLHVVYELQLVNTQATAAPLTRVEVRSVSPRGTVAVFEGAELTARLRRLDTQPVAEPVLDPHSQLLLLVDLAFLPTDEVPVAVSHRLTLAPSEASPTERTATVAQVDLVGATPVVVGAPVAGANWVVTGGCCGPSAPHRSAILPTDAGLSVAERFAVDLRQLDDTGRFVAGDPGQAQSYAGYGANVLAVAPGRVVTVEAGFAEQVPGEAPAPGTFAPDTAEGNSVVVDIGNGVFAFYGQLQAGSIIVQPGDRVRRGQPLARLGHSGDARSPHLHFHLMSGDSVVGSEGLPFVLNAFGYSGQIDPTRYAAANVAGDYGTDRFPTPLARTRQLPLDLAILDFVASPGSSGNPLA